jgi:ubiquinone/menaquinone biosynthesis C-methylase UbiE
MTLLNLGCGGKISAHPHVTNIDWSIALRVRKSRILRCCAPLYLRGERLVEFSQLPDNILVHNLAKGIPFADETVDAVYHSHLLEHLDHHVVPAFFAEVFRVLKPGGIHRVVVPDLERLARHYLQHCELCDQDPGARRDHDQTVAAIIEQSVRRESYGTSQQKPLRRYVENPLFGDARQRGETHQWMYDQHNLTYCLEQAGFSKVVRQDFQHSVIPDWTALGLDFKPNRTDEYKPGSLYMDAVK